MVIFPLGYWTPWPSDCLVPFDSSKQGVGRGEERLAREIGQFLGAVQGIRSRFDILGIDGRKYEVKEPVGSSWEIRATSKRVSSFFIAHLLNACEELADRVDDPRWVSKIDDFIDVFSEGNICDSTMLGRIPKKGKRVYGFCEFIETMQKVSDDHSVVLEHPFLRVPGLLRRKWETSVRASGAFKVVDGLILVNEKLGYHFIPKEDLDNELVFSRLSQGAPRFQICLGPSSTPKRRDPVVTSSTTASTSPSLTANGPASTSRPSPEEWTSSTSRYDIRGG